MLKIRNLKKHFGGIAAVDNCSFDVVGGCITALIGPNGSGKTTIFNLISGILRADSGKIFLDKKNITNNDIADISNFGISRSFQRPKLFDNLTVRDNLLLAINKEDTKFWKNLFSKNITRKRNEKIDKISELVGIDNIQKKLARNLSYGQKKLVAMARTILNPHDILILDEPVAGVNPVLKKRIANILIELRKRGETIFLIEHDINFILEIADKVIVMNEGKIITEGTPDDIKNDPRVLDVYLGRTNKN